MAEKSHPEARIFYVDSRFERMARRPGAVAREQALADAEAQVEELRTDFGDWLERELQQLSAALSQIEDDPSDMALLDRADSNCAQLRDIGTTMGFELVTFVARSLCTILQTIKAGAAYDKDMVDCHINALFLVRTEPYRDLSPTQVPEMSSGLRRIVELVIRTAPGEPVQPAEPSIVGQTPPDDDSLS